MDFISNVTKGHGRGRCTAQLFVCMHVRQKLICIHLSRLCGCVCIKGRINQYCNIYDLLQSLLRCTSIGIHFV